ncbi:MAG TPA: flagellar basal body P-ring formation chaperone FlgA [Planctomycetota bacterium]|nr:flagellar basal body P-ring formation chaperone FlgA [Planctomycetota bacterium]
MIGRALLALLVVGSLVSGEVTIALRPVVSLAAERATLAEVAELTGDQALITVISGMTVTELPDLRERRLEPDEIRRAIGQGLGSSLIIHGDCRVSRRGQVIAEQDLVAAAKALVAANGDDLTITVLRSSGVATIPDGGSEPMLSAQALDNSRSGDIPFRIRVMRGEVELARALVTLRVERHRQMTVAARAIRRGERIGPGDLRRERVAVERTSVQSLAPEEMVGKEARLDIAEGTSLTERVVIQSPAVRTGQSIALLVTSERFQLTATGEALNDGRIGDQIAVRRTADGRTVRGTVVAEGQVRLDR